MSYTETKEAFATHLETLGVSSSLLDTIAVRTLAIRSQDQTLRTNPGDFLHTLPELLVDEMKDPDLRPDFVPIETLGEGGMGLVRLANQTSLDREVAVKTVRDEKDDAVAQSLLQEAYVTGFLEHPNIIPVYSVGRTDAGAPLIVMKRVEGISWYERLDESHRSGEAIDFESELEILVQVCHAVEFAHDKGILHRDIKTENIMIGHFGEVYLLDWGLAVTNRSDRPLLPTLNDASSLCGTPCYMAPEMARQDYESIDERTDIYLLGATLHDVLTGAPRHRGETLLNVLFHAAQSKPVDYDDQIPAELASIANRACHRDPTQRFQSVTEFRQAIQAFLEHRESVTISDDADRTRQRLQRLVEDVDTDTSDAIQDLFGECRFGYKQALRLWPENPAATSGLQDCLEMMVDHYMACEKIEAARTCLTDLPAPNPRLEARVQKLEQRLRDEHQDFKRLQKLEENLDLRTSRRTRIILMLSFGVIWFATSAHAAFDLRGTDLASEATMRRYVTAGVRNLGIGVIAMVFGWRKLNANAANRQLAFAMATLLGLIAILRWGVFELGGSMSLGAMGESLFIALFLAFVGLVSDLRICAVGLLFLAMAVITIVAPDLHLYFYPPTVLFTCVLLAWLWSPGQLKKKVAL